MRDGGFFYVTMQLNFHANGLAATDRLKVGLYLDVCKYKAANDSRDDRLSVSRYTTQHVQKPYYELYRRSSSDFPARLLDCRRQIQCNTFNWISTTNNDKSRRHNARSASAVYFSIFD